jgi:hypothetical protein
MPGKRYTPEEILQHLRTVELDTGEGLAVLDACRKLGITEQNAGAVSGWRAVLHAYRSAGPDGILADPLQHGPSTQQSRGPTTRSQNHPACGLRANMIGGTTTPGWSASPSDVPDSKCCRHNRRDRSHSRIRLKSVSEIPKLTPVYEGDKLEPSTYAYFLQEVLNEENHAVARCGFMSGRC